MMVLKNGCRVKVEYIGRLDDGTIFDQADNKNPLEFVIGENKIIPEFEKTVMEMVVGERKTITIPTNEAYGERDDTLIRRFEKTILPDNFIPEKGMEITIHLSNGGVLPAVILDITDADIIVDLNHPLAGKDLIFEITLLEVQKVN